MKHLMITFCITLSLCASAWSQPAAVPVPGKARSIDSVAISNRLAKTGGILLHSVYPSFLLLNTQTRIPSVVFGDISNHILIDLSVSSIYQSRTTDEPITEALKSLSNTNFSAVVIITDVEGYPSLLVAPESRWALVNVASLCSENVTADKLIERAQKETWRAFGYVMGAANSTVEPCLLKPVFAPTDLDALNTKILSPEPFNKIMETAQKLGMHPTSTATYRKAVEEGWAPAPTNDFQRSIWNELKK